MNSALWNSDWNLFKFPIKYSGLTFFLNVTQFIAGQVNTNGPVPLLDAINGSPYSGSCNISNDI
jgi:hypothetical protein